MNIVLLEGMLSRPATTRELPSGSVLCTLELTTRGTDGAATSVPVSWFDPPTTPSWDAGTDLVVFGTVRRRFFRAGGGTQSRTEVVAEQVVAADERRRAGRVRELARRALSG